MRPALAALALILAAGCRAAPEPGRDAAGFPLPDRPVAEVVSGGWSTEPERDRLREADEVMRLGGVARGMTVADIGAGEGYYTVRLAKRVGKDGRVLGEDIVPAYHDALAARVARDQLDNVSVKLGRPDDPMLPEASFDRILMIHMYHEVDDPYALLWKMRPALKRDGEIVVVDADRQTNAHGTPPALLRCEFAAVGYAQVSSTPLKAAGGYIARFRAEGPRPAPRAIQPCRA